MGNFIKENYKTLVSLKTGDTFSGIYLMENAAVKTTKNGGQYLDCILRDKTGEVSAKMWDYTGSVHEESKQYPIIIEGVLSEFRGKKQITISSAHRAVEGFDDYDMSSLIQTASNTEEHLEDILNVIKDMKDETYQKISFAAVNDILGDTLKTLPAAKSVHHNFQGGLLTHLHGMVKMAGALVQIYDPSHKFINADLLIAGVICHDIAKRNEFEIGISGQVTEYTMTGKLLGHVVMGTYDIGKIGESLNLDENDMHIVLLKHMILSHHGEPEYGAAVRPMTVEAEILSRLDMMDARIEVYRMALEDIPMNSWSQHLMPLSHSVFKHE